MKTGGDIFIATQLFRFYAAQATAWATTCATEDPASQAMGWSPPSRRFAGWQGGDTAVQHALEDALEGLAAAKHQRRPLGYGTPWMGEAHAVGPEPPLGSGRRLVERPECGDWGGGHRR